MAEYRLTNRQFSRLWRRSKKYREHEIRWLARKRGMEVTELRGGLQVVDPKTKKVVANFQKLAEASDIPVRERASVFAALKVGLYLLLALPAAAQTYQERVVAAVLMGEAWGEGERGMIAVAEVINQRSKDQSKTPLQVVTFHVGKVHAFSCLNGTTPERLVGKFQKERVYQTALKIAHVACAAPETLPGLTKHATHFTRTTEKPWWARKHKAVAIVGNHSFYKMEQY